MGCNFVNIIGNQCSERGATDTLHTFSIMNFHRRCRFDPGEAYILNFDVGTQHRGISEENGLVTTAVIIPNRHPNKQRSERSVLSLSTTRRLTAVIFQPRRSCLVSASRSNDCRSLSWLNGRSYRTLRQNHPLNRQETTNTKCNYP